MRKTLLLLSVIIIVFACNKKSQPTHISYLNPFDLEDMDYEMDVKKFMFGSDSENETSVAISADTLAIFDEMEKTLGAYNKGSNRMPWGVEYYQSEWEDDIIMATYGPLGFCRLRMIADMKNQPLAVCASGEDLDMGLIDRTISYCDERFGESKITKDHFINSYYIYTWQNQKETIKLVTNRFCNQCDIDDNYLRAGENGGVPKDLKTHTDGNYVYLFIIKNDYVTSIVDKISSGDFLFCKSGYQIDKTVMISSSY